MFSKFHSKPYVLDFGYIVVNKLEIRTIKIINYYPWKIRINLLIDKMKLEKRNIKINIKENNFTLKPFEMYELSIIIEPTFKVYNKINMEINEFIKLQVS